MADIADEVEGTEQPAPPLPPLYGGPGISTAAPPLRPPSAGQAAARVGIPQFLGGLLAGVQEFGGDLPVVGEATQERELRQRAAAFPPGYEVPSFFPASQVERPDYEPMLAAYGRGGPQDYLDVLRARLERHAEEERNAAQLRANRQAALSVAMTTGTVEPRPGMRTLQQEIAARAQKAGLVKAGFTVDEAARTFRGVPEEDVQRLQAIGAPIPEAPAPPVNPEAVSAPVRPSKYEVGEAGATPEFSKLTREGQEGFRVQTASDPLIAPYAAHGPGGPIEPFRHGGIPGPLATGAAVEDPLILERLGPETAEQVGGPKLAFWAQQMKVEPGELRLMLRGIAASLPEDVAGPLREAVAEGRPISPTTLEFIDRVAIEAGLPDIDVTRQAARAAVVADARRTNRVTESFGREPSNAETSIAEKTAAKRVIISDPERRAEVIGGTPVGPLVQAVLEHGRAAGATDEEIVAGLRRLDMTEADARAAVGAARPSAKVGARAPTPITREPYPSDITPGVGPDIEAAQMQRRTPPSVELHPKTGLFDEAPAGLGAEEMRSQLGLENAPRGTEPVRATSLFEGAAGGTMEPNRFLPPGGGPPGGLPPGMLPGEPLRAPPPARNPAQRAADIIGTSFGLTRDLVLSSPFAAVGRHGLSYLGDHPGALLRALTEMGKSGVTQLPVVSRFLEDSAEKTYRAMLQGPGLSLEQAEARGVSARPSAAYRLERGLKLVPLTTAPARAGEVQDIFYTNVRQNIPFLTYNRKLYNIYRNTVSTQVFDDIYANVAKQFRNDSQGLNEYMDTMATLINHRVGISRLESSDVGRSLNRFFGPAMISMRYTVAEVQQLGDLAALFNPGVHFQMGPVEMAAISPVERAALLRNAVGMAKVIGAWETGLYFLQGSGLIRTSLDPTDQDFMAATIQRGPLAGVRVANPFLPMSLISAAVRFAGYQHDARGQPLHPGDYGWRTQAEVVADYLANRLVPGIGTMFDLAQVLRGEADLSKRPIDPLHEVLRTIGPAPVQEYFREFERSVDLAQALAAFSAFGIRVSPPSAKRDGVGRVGAFDLPDTPALAAWNAARASSAPKANGEPSFPALNPTAERTVPGGVKGVLLDDKEFDRLQELTGLAREQHISALTSTRAWASLGQGDKEKRLLEARERADKEGTAAFGLEHAQQAPDDRGRTAGALIALRAAGTDTGRRMDTLSTFGQAGLLTQRVRESIDDLRTYKDPLGPHYQLTVSQYLQGADMVRDYLAAPAFRHGTPADWAEVERQSERLRTAYQRIQREAEQQNKRPSQMANYRTYRDDFNATQVGGLRIQRYLEFDGRYRHDEISAARTAMAQDPLFKHFRRVVADRDPYRTVEEPAP